MAEKQLTFEKIRSEEIAPKGANYQGKIAYEDLHVEGEQGIARFVVIMKWKMDSDGIATDKKKIYLPVRLFDEMIKVYPRLSLPA